VTDDLTGYDDLFGGEKLPGLFDKTMDVGTTRTGIIVKEPVKRQSRFYKADGSGKPKFWGVDGKPTAETRAADGTALRPVMDEVFVLDTDYRLTDMQLAAKDMDEDNGQRGVFAGGADLKAVKAAIKKSGAKSRADLVGARLTLTRTGKKIVGDFEVWEWDASIELDVRPKPAAAADEFAP
jgi:hypothetical protein